MSAKNILFHPHYLGELMTEPQGKSPLEKWQDAEAKVKKLGAECDAIPQEKRELKSSVKKIEAYNKAKALADELELRKDVFEPSETCKKRLVKIFVESHYGRERDIENKYMKKGLQVEEDAITLYSRNKKTPYYKNKETFRNEFLEGTPDFGSERIIYNSSIIVDTKASWDLFTFWNARTTSLNGLYYWQGQGYCDLIPSAKKCMIAYCLIDTPSTLIFDEQQRLKFKMGVINPEKDIEFNEACAKIQHNMTYGDIPLEEKLFEIEVQRDDEAIERMHKRIIDCREWMDNNLFNQVKLAGALLEDKKIEV